MTEVKEEASSKAILQKQPLIFFYQNIFEKSVGIINSLPDGALTASDSYSQDFYPIQCRIGQKGCWAGKQVVGDTLIIDLLSTYMVTGFGTQGDRGTQWATEYKVETSLNGKIWKNIGEFIGNFDATTFVKRGFSVPVRASFLRITPTKSVKHACLSIDIYVYNPK